jgi:hypothetical protein
MTAVAAAVIVIGTAFASLAKDRGGPPTIDIQKVCHENIAALQTLLGTDILQTEDICVSDERSARDQLVKDWASYPALAKSQCVQPREYLPGYIEWLTCIEMTRDVLQMRKKEGTPSAADSTTVGQSSKHRVGPATSECPVVKYKENGDIAYVINCPGVAMPGIQ